MPRSTVTKTISLERTTLRKGVKSTRKRGFKNNFSGYIGKLIEDDAQALAAPAPAAHSRNGHEMAVTA